ncbi:peptidoglycan DD-metalloendopeptidase family protein [uncultured Psychroserpens sp.]|uniref:peptidoglycan DD-metalloendopeptidase family protein n=1 Tax=uncultured Psychroserpens sp. TaxID=255436 RepID=UPI00262906C7|nr:peptidoglycan DD-metalloendopeptidase family protein [uncultured Psychroserpens sp.]
MKKVVFVLSVLFASYMSFSQEQEHYNVIASQFKDLYNANDYKAVFELFNEGMQKALPIDNTKAFISNMKSTLGTIKSVEFNRLKNDAAHIYKMTFDSELRDILFYLDDSNKIAGLLVTPHKPNNLPVIERNTTKMILPFKEEWFVFWGGTNVGQNYHVAYENQQYAYDILIMKDGVSHKGDSKVNENYYVFGKDIIAPCDAKVVEVITGVKDNIPGELNPEQLTGNTVVLQTENEEYLLFAHLKEKSIVVKEGQMVKQGDLMGQCGNSGNTTEAHLHLSLQNVADMNIATGGKLFFDDILVNGEIKKNYLPVKGDQIKNKN